MELIEKMMQSLGAQMEAQADDALPSSIHREAGRVWLSGWFDMQAALTAMLEHAGEDAVTEGDRLLVHSIITQHTHSDFSSMEAAARHRATAFAAGRAAREREIVEWLRHTCRRGRASPLSFDPAGRSYSPTPSLISPCALWCATIIWGEK